MSEKLSRSARRFQRLLSDAGYARDVVELPDSTRTAEDAARAIGCSVPQIAKSLVFRGRESGEALLAIVSGSNQADTQRLAALAGEPIDMADADFVREHTGYAIGGVPPACHPAPVRTFIDDDLPGFDDIWAAAGTPRAVFGLTPDELRAMTYGRVATIKQ